MLILHMGRFFTCYNGYKYSRLYSSQVKNTTSVQAMSDSPNRTGLRAHEISLVVVTHSYLRAVVVCGYILA